MKRAVISKRSIAAMLVAAAALAAGSFAGTGHSQSTPVLAKAFYWCPPAC